MFAWLKRITDRSGPPGNAVRDQRRAFEAATINRLTETWLGSCESLDDDLKSQGDRLRKRSNDLFQNNEFAKRYGHLVVNNIVGPEGFVLQAQVKDPDGRLDKGANDAIETAWWDWQKIADITGRLTFVDMLRVQIRTLPREGELIFHMREVGGELKLRMLPPAALDSTLNIERTPGGGRIIMGVEVDADGRPVMYHFRRKDGRPDERYHAEDIVHAFIQEAPDQHRGVPWLHAVMRRLHDLNGYREAAVIAARVGAAKMGIWTTPDGGPPPGSEPDKKGDYITDAEPGHFDYAPDGYQLSTFDPAYPHDQFGDFCQEAMHGVAAGGNVAYHQLSGNLTGVNYNSGRIGELTDRDNWMALQNTIINMVLERIYLRWLRGALTFQKIRLANGSALPHDKFDKFKAHLWQPRRWPWVDPLKDINAAIAAMKAGVDSPQAVAARAGRDIEDVLDDIQRFQQMVKDRDITLGESSFAPDPGARE